MGWVCLGSLLVPIHGTSQQPAELQMKDEALELAIETVNKIKQRMRQEKHKVIKSDASLSNITQGGKGKMTKQ